MHMDVHSATSFVGRELGSWWNKYISNDVGVWEAVYRRAYHEKLGSSAPMVRHHVIAGIVEDLVRPGALLLDAGCGCGTTYGVLRGRNFRYRGIDFSAEAIGRCRASFVGEDVQFARADIGDYGDDFVYDAVILNEVLYYFPVTRAARIVRRLVGMLARPHGVLIISMSRTFKAWRIWQACKSLMSPTKAFALSENAHGNAWDIRAYRPFFPRKDLLGSLSSAILCDQDVNSVEQQGLGFGPRRLDEVTEPCGTPPAPACRQAKHLRLLRICW
jgi:SAM-dependent methyltransferase